MFKHILSFSILGSFALASNLYNVDLYTDKKSETNKVEVKIEKPIEQDIFTIKSFITLNDKYNWAIEPDLSLDKEYRYSQFKTENWQEILSEIAEYEDLLFKINEDSKTIKIQKKIKTKVEIQHLPQNIVESILDKLKKQYVGVEIYKFKNVIYIEGDRTSVETILDYLKQYNDEVTKSMRKYVVNVYKVKRGKEGITPMIDKFNIEKVNKVVIKNPKINKGYLINLGNKQLIIKINSNNIEVNGATLDKSDLKYYGYSIDDWFVEIKSVQI